jgi:hypothetical protein
MSKRVLEACQADVRSARLLGEFGECSCHRRASLRLPPLEFRAQSGFAAIDERVDRLRVRDSEDELQSSQLRVSTSAAEVGIRGSATSASPTRPSPSRSRVSTALMRAP